MSDTEEPNTIPACPTWCTDHREHEVDGQKVSYHSGPLYAGKPSPGPGLPGSHIRLWVSQHYDEENGPYKASVGMQLWVNDVPRSLDSHELREIAAAMLVGADVIDAAAGADPVFLQPLRIVRSSVAEVEK
jgi:hypothetical protein